MTLIYQSPALVNTMFEAVTEVASPATTSYRIAVAYVTYEGARTLVEGLADRVGPSWNEIPKCVVTCFDFGRTEPTALTYLESHGFTVRIANLGADGAIRITPNPSSFHPKIYLAPTASVVPGVIGSANLSRRALTINTEAATVVELTADEAATLWDRAVASSVELTTDLLVSYVSARPQQRAVQSKDEPRVPAHIPANSLPVFRSAVEAGEVDPAAHAAFWVEVGGPSGGSSNQLELPRRGQHFFGFVFNDYDDEHQVIGEPVLATPTGSWSCRLTWHGNNKMERINLPTTARSGLVYAHQVVLFRRSGQVFDIQVAAPDSPRARRWRDESAAAGTIYRFSQGSSRRAGLI